MGLPSITNKKNEIINIIGKKIVNIIKEIKISKNLIFEQIINANQIIKITY